MTETNGSSYPNGDEEQSELTDEIDHQILMHRDAHFGGDFGVMLNYYQGENIGIYPEFDLERIEYLATVEQELGKNLAPLILSGTEAEQVASSRRAYEQLKEIYAHENPESHFPRLIADLILTEEEEPEEEIQAIVSQGTRILPELLQILKSEEAYDPLFPGYGYAPYMAILCLGKIGDPSGIVPIFEILGKETTFEEEVLTEALREIGEPAKEFLIKVLKSRPLTEDNINAAFALTIFADDPKVALIAFEQLKDSEVQQRAILRTYLICCCELLSTTPEKQAFIDMSKDLSISQQMRSEMEQLIHDWK